MDLYAVVADQNPWWQTPGAKPVLHLTERRCMFDALYSAIGEPEQSRAQILLGPRQVGKSTLLLQLVRELLNADVPAQNVTYFDFSDDRLAERSVSPRDVFGLTAPGLVETIPRYFFFDEITWAKPGWDRWLKQAIDLERRVGTSPRSRFVLTSSSASLLRDASLESGQGRWDNHFLEGLTFPEYERLSLRKHPEAVLRYLRTSGYPGQLLEDDTSLARKRLREDIIDRAILHDLLPHNVDVARVKTLFTYLIQTSGSQWDAGNRARDLDADPRTVSQWLRLLEQTGLITALPRWTPGKSGRAGSASNELRSHPKIFASDHGLVLAFAAGGAADDPHVQARVFESVVFSHLRSVQESRGDVAYFRVDNRREIDFVVPLGGDRVGVEVTYAKTVDREKLAKVAAAGDRLGTRRLVVVYGGLFEEDRDGIRLVPIHRFLSDTKTTLEGGRA
jgi:predicted AAA+ superfamily ATPase